MVKSSMWSHCELFSLSIVCKIKYSQGYIHHIYCKIYVSHWNVCFSSLYQAKIHKYIICKHLSLYVQKQQHGKHVGMYHTHQDVDMTSNNENDYSDKNTLYG